jgi:hypothetical protein
MSISNTNLPSEKIQTHGDISSEGNYIFGAQMLTALAAFSADGPLKGQFISGKNAPTVDVPRDYFHVEPAALQKAMVKEVAEDPKFADRMTRSVLDHTTKLIGGHSPS